MALPKKGVWNFRALRTPAFIEAGEFQTPFWAQHSESFSYYHPPVTEMQRSVVQKNGDWLSRTLCLSPLCAVTRRRSSVGAIPTRQLSLQPVAIGAVVEVTKLPKPLMERTVKRFREQAGRNASERRAGLETGNVGADPAMGWGRPRSQVSGERNDPSCGPTGVMATACLDREIGRNTGDPKPWTT